MTAWRLSGRRDHRYRRAPWPGPRRGPAGRAARPHASGARAGPSAGEYESAALFLISLAGHPIPWGPVAGSRALVDRLLGERYGLRPCVGRHPKVPARWNIAVRRSVTPKVLRADWGGGVRGSGPAAGPARRPRSGWRRRSCPPIGPEALSGTLRHAVGLGKKDAIPIGWMQACGRWVLRASATASSVAEMTAHSTSMACCRPRRWYRRRACGRALPRRGRRWAWRGQWAADRPRRTRIFSPAGISSPAASRLKMLSMEASLGQSRPGRPQCSPGPACLVR